MTVGFQSGEAFAVQMDAEDPLARFRDRFLFPRTPSREPFLYLCGHSLGLQPKSARARIEEELNVWADLAVEGHFVSQNPWISYHRLLTPQSAALVGALEAEVVVMNTLTVNLHLMMVTFYRPTQQRHKIIIERGAFPSDQYAVKSQIRFHGFDPANSLIELTARDGESCLRDEDIAAAIDREGDSVALILLPGVNFSTGQLYDLAEIAKLGRRKGCAVGFDLAHAAGNVPLHLHEWAPDFAVWCNYKYLNGGPGCVGSCFVHERHARSFDLPRFSGWWANRDETRFEMGPDLDPIPGAEGWQVSNHPILALAPIRASLDIFAEAGFENLRAKSLNLTAYMEFLLTRESSDKFDIITPKVHSRRGAQLSIRIARNGRQLCQRLIDHGVLGDWREPDIFRVAAVPLYNSYKDVHRFVQKFLAAV